MRGYGLPREHGVNSPDKGDITRYGLNTSAGGERRRTLTKRIARRVWKKSHRFHLKREIFMEVNEYHMKTNEDRVDREDD